MLLITHILIAGLGILLSTLACLVPRRNLIKISKYAIGATLVTGSTLVIKSHSSLSGACLVGLGYVAYTAAMLALATYRLE